MEPVIMEDPRWALVTLLFTALLGMIMWLFLMVLIESRSVSKNVKRVSAPILFIFYMAWLFTLGDPHSSMNLEVLYHKSINYFPETRFGKIFKRPHSTNAVPVVTNAPVTVKTNK